MQRLILFVCLAAGLAAAPPKVLFVVTSHAALGDTGAKTGCWLSEVTHPYLALHDAGIAVDIASPKGGRAPVDPRSEDRNDPDNARFLADKHWALALRATRPLAGVRAADYAAVYFAGGHGTMWDFPRNADIQRLVRAIWDAGGLVAATCHGPAAFVGIDLADGSAFVAGRKLTAFTDQEEDKADLGAVVPFYLESMLRKLGARFVAAEPYTANVVVDDRLITGQNPASARGVGEELARRLAPNADKLTVVAESDHQWTGVAVSRHGRIFVCFPRWSDDVPMAVAEVLAGGKLQAYPNAAVNTRSLGDDPGSRFVCGQSVVIDDENDLWVLDPANPRLAGIVEGGTKLVQISLFTNEIVRTIPFGAPAIRPGSYLNDVRVDRRRGVAYVTDSGDGAILLVDLGTGNAVRRLDDHHSTEAELMDVTVDGKPWRRPDGSRPRVHADGIALDAAGGLLYYRALTSRFVYAVPVADLTDPTLSERDLAYEVKVMAVTGPCDGMLMGRDGWLYLTAIDQHAVERWRAADGVQTVVADPRLVWPDTLTQGPDGALYVTSSQPDRGAGPPPPYRLFRLQP